MLDLLWAPLSLIYFVGSYIVAKVKVRDSALPAIRGIHGELLLRGQRAEFAHAALEVIGALVLLAFHWWVRTAIDRGLGLLLLTLAVTAVLIRASRHFARALRERFVITGEGISWIHGWRSKRLHLLWRDVTKVTAEKRMDWIRHDDIEAVELRGPDKARIKMPIGVIGYYELLEAIEAKVPRERWSKSFAQLGDSARRRRERELLMRDPSQLPRPEFPPWS